MARNRNTWRRLALTLRRPARREWQFLVPWLDGRARYRARRHELRAER